MCGSQSSSSCPFLSHYGYIAETMKHRMKTAHDRHSVSPRILSQTLQTLDIQIWFIQPFYRYRGPNYEQTLHETVLICVSFLPYKEVRHKNKTDFPLPIGQFNFPQILILMSVQGPINSIRANNIRTQPSPPITRIPPHPHLLLYTLQ
jgi:hypothetical protein